MTKMQAWVILAWSLALPLLGFFLVWWGSILVQTITSAFGGVTLTGPIRLSQNQAILFAAVLTAAVSLVGSWSVKSREFRNARADQVAQVALDFHGSLEAALDAVTSEAADNSSERIEKLNAEASSRVEALTRERLLPSFTPERGEQELKRIQRLVEEAQGLHAALATRKWRSWLDAHSAASSKLSMYATTDVTFFATRASAAVRLYSVQATSANRAQASDELGRFLYEARLSVETLRRWWGPRLTRASRVFLLIWADRLAASLRAIRGT